MWSTSPCSVCGSKRIMNVNGKTSDMCQVVVDSLSIDSDGYVPDSLPFSGSYGDYIEFSLCLDCGRMQGEFPIPDEKITELLE